MVLDYCDLVESMNLKSLKCIYSIFYRALLCIKKFEMTEKRPPITQCVQKVDGGFGVIGQGMNRPAPIS